MIHHECGLFGIFDQPDAARLAYFGLYAQQHRGQESAGIVTIDGHGMHDHRGMGLVPDVFTEESLRRLTGMCVTPQQAKARRAMPSRS